MQPETNDDGGIGGYYDRIEREKREAWARADDAREAGAPADEIQRLRELAHDAGDTGD